MKVLFLHNNFPAQYRHVAAALAQDPANSVVFATHNRQGNLPGVGKLLFKPSREPAKETHHYLRGTESAVLNGQAVFRACIELRKRGFIPDVICGHSGWGPTLYVKDIFPEARLLCYFEWYYHARGSDADFLIDSVITHDDACRIRTRNAPILLDLAQCDWGLTPTMWQQSQFPDIFRPRMSVLHDGVDTDFFRPARDATLKLDGLDLSGVDEIITYATRGMEPYRGFPEFMRAAAQLLEMRPGAHVVVVGDDRVAYGKRLPDGESWKKRMLSELELELDPKRIHFTGLLPYSDYLKVLQASTVHVYLTVPFVLSWSLMEAMATGCMIVASDTPPVREVLRDGHNGLLVDFFDVEALAEGIDLALEKKAEFERLRRNARRTIVEQYALSRLLPRHLSLIGEIAAGRIPPRVPLAPEQETMATGTGGAE
ncbi:glycosyltransferase family 4 protein [Oceanibacterium hippocampi]|uniref:D-inositol-3-phosphate glycosyltransferase n=1 Tax=Oceanibacterium hippocampi TaxID=745714 RepID=A0A1Y5RMX7_9PROT|nr:glycosyltransferase family 4 protein [Oceanibacterium hippocampi]SLN21206.1 D-inositol-3-phosphate glycosyltransferase [Oceanibacterium hippocampi]